MARVGWLRNATVLPTHSTGIAAPICMHVPDTALSGTPTRDSSCSFAAVVSGNAVLACGGTGLNALVLAWLSDASRQLRSCLASMIGVSMTERGTYGAGSRRGAADTAANEALPMRGAGANGVDCCRNEPSLRDALRPATDDAIECAVIVGSS